MYINTVYAIGFEFENQANIYLCSVFEVVSMFKLRAQHSRNSEMFIFENDKVANAFELFDALFIGDWSCCADINSCFWFLSIYDVFFNHNPSPILWKWSNFYFLQILWNILLVIDWQRHLESRLIRLFQSCFVVCVFFLVSFASIPFYEIQNDRPSVPIHD